MNTLKELHLSLYLLSREIIIILNYYSTRRYSRFEHISVLQCQSHIIKIQYKLISRYKYDDKDGNSKRVSYKDYPLIPFKNQAFLKRPRGVKSELRLVGTADKDCRNLEIPFRYLVLHFAAVGLN